MRQQMANDAEFFDAPDTFVRSDLVVQDSDDAPQVFENDDLMEVEDGLEAIIYQQIQDDYQIVEDDQDADLQEQIRRESEASISDSLPIGDICPSARVEVLIPRMSHETLSEYDETYSSIVERVLGSFRSRREQKLYQVEFTDGREDLLSLDQLSQQRNGRASLHHFNIRREEADMNRKRKYSSEDEWDSITDNGLSGLSDSMILDDDDEIDDDDDDNDDVQGAEAPAFQTRRLRSREASKRLSHDRDFASSNDNGSRSRASSQPTRRLRTRQPRQLLLSEMKMKHKNPDVDRDELSINIERQSDDDDDGDFLPVISDIATGKSLKNKTSRYKRPRLKRGSRPTRETNLRGKKSNDSDIEFEQPRRSSRATKNTQNMGDDSFLDDDSFYVIDEKSSPVAPRVMSIKEVFQSIAADSSFGSVHMQHCHTCGSSRQRGQILYCQGCSLAFHKQCIGFRSVREHQATKVSDDNFVLQCRFCIGVYKKRDPNAPDHSMCQVCRETGKACAAFSQKKTIRQEEKIREQNDGVDPITPVSPELINSADKVLLRCSTCCRAWHQEHLPSASGESIETDVKSESFKNFSIDWRCNDCSSAKSKLHRLVAWRPDQQPESGLSKPLAYEDVIEDRKEYLVKWQDASYAHCTWVSGAWLYGVAAPTMRTAFGRRAAENDLLKFSKKEAVPDEYLMSDTILNVKMTSSTLRGRSKSEDLANISSVTKIFVKFQGLGYDDVVWDSAPTKDNSEIYNSFVEAYREYIERKYFQTDSQHKIRERIRAYKDEPFAELETQPAGLKRGKLMGYQVEGLNWLLQNYHQGRSVVLADEMGLGKTVQVVGLITSLIQDGPRCWPFLVVVPNSTCPNWRREFKQWAPDIRVVTYHGGKEPQELAYKYELFPNGSTEMKAHVVIMSYDSAQDPRTPPLFKSVRWVGLVVDEGQRLKNDQNLLYVALRAMRIPFRLLLTGTPLQNNKRELFNLLQFIDETQDAAALDEKFFVLDKETLPKLHDKIRPYFLRRTKAGVLKFLPPMAQIILPVTMSVIQEKLSKSILAKNPQLIQAVFANSKMGKKDRGSLNNILMQLRKCLCHPFMYSDAIEERHEDAYVLHRNLVEASAKLLLLEIMLPKLKERGHRVLIFSQFLQQLDIIEDFLSGLGFDYRRLDGSISSLEKQRRIDAYNEPDSNIFAFLLSTRAGGVGINLATADTVIIMDPDFNPHQDMQALSRAHRIGQKNKVLCFQLVTKDSVEERIMQMGRKKMALDHALIESMDDDELAGDDLESILKHGAQALFDEDYEKTSIQYDSASVDKLLDRSQVEQTATNEEGSGETQFTYARVWSNDKLGFEENQDLGEEEAPEPINSSVWDQILAQREEEARREAEASKEVLGRGARRRTAINYKTNVIDQANLPNDDAVSSDTSDEYSGADSQDESDDDEEIISEKEQTSTEQVPQLVPLRPIPPPVVLEKRRGRPPKTAQPTQLPQRPTTYAFQVASQSNNLIPGQWAQPQQPIQVQQRSSGFQVMFSYLPVAGQSAPGYTVAPSPGFQPLTNLVPPADGRIGAPTIVAQSMQSQLSYIARLNSEAQLRLAIDAVQRSAANNITKQIHISALLHKIQQIRAMNGPRQG